MILPKLKQATRERHIALESQMPLLDPLLSHAIYRQLLRKFYGYYAPLEMQLLTLPWWDEIDFGYTDRYKTPRLARDLIALGDTPDTLPLMPFCQALPTVVTLPDLLGCLYVIESMTLGGQVITRHLKNNLKLTLASGTEFFNGYGAETGTRWQAFCTMLTTQAAKTADDESILATANKTFDTLDQWLFPAA